MEYIGKSLVVDMRVADGNVYFEAEQLIWRARPDTKLANKVVIKYSDIFDIKVDKSNDKRRVTIVLKDYQEVNFYLYDLEEFLEYVQAGREANK